MFASGWRDVIMARDHRKLRVFHDAHSLTLAIYKHTKSFPKDEWFGMRTQMRRAATSVPTNIVEGSARRTTADYLNFLYVALGSASELKYLAGLAADLEFLPVPVSTVLADRCDHVVRQLERLVDSVEVLLASERRAKKQQPRTAVAGSR
jgi:four helix bundle protein